MEADFSRSEDVAAAGLVIDMAAQECFLLLC
jgi:hypothetical protein